MVHQYWLDKGTGGQLILWCSGYHVSLTHSRSQLWSWVESLFANFYPPHLPSFFPSSFISSLPLSLSPFFFFSFSLPSFPYISFPFSLLFPLLTLPFSFPQLLQKSYKYGCDLLSAAQRTRTACSLDLYPNGVLLEELGGAWEKLSGAAVECRARLVVAQQFHMMSDDVSM